ncbi:MAG: hypothetical protein IJE78_04840 [Bacteroidaceae bacterium]|nr:hypothetical protein [Bacteroidaceae bacterium]
MVSYADIRNAYIDLYREMRRYIWDFRIVEQLVEVEIDSFQTCVDMDKLREDLRLLRQHINEVISDDEDLKDAIDAFQDIVDNETETFAKLYQVSEVLPNENSENSEEERSDAEYIDEEADEDFDSEFEEE